MSIGSEAGQPAGAAEVAERERARLREFELQAYNSRVSVGGGWGWVGGALQDRTQRLAAIDAMSVEALVASAEYNEKVQQGLKERALRAQSEDQANSRPRPKL